MRLPPNLIALIGVNIALAAAAGLVAWVPAHYEARLETLIRPIPMPNSPPTIPPATAANVQAMRNAPMFYQARAIVVVEDPALIMATRPDYILAAAMILPQGHSTAYATPPEWRHPDTGRDRQSPNDFGRRPPGSPPLSTAAASLTRMVQIR